MRSLALALLAACGHDAALADAQPDVLTGACIATYSGNFVEAVAAPDACARVEAGTVIVALPSGELDAPPEPYFAVTAPGSYSPATVADWRLDGVRTRGTDRCLVEAGAAVTPHGSFALELASVSPPHGTLVIDAVVIATAFSDCGDPLAEHVEVTF
jgi:hypothetical protein